MIFSTKEFKLNTIDNLGIRFGLIAQRRWPYWAGLLVAGKVIQFIPSPVAEGIGLLMMAFGFSLPIIALISSYFDVLSPLNSVYLQPRVITFDDEGLFIQIKEGDSIMYHWTSIVSAQKWQSYYLLFLSKDQFISIPASSFYTNADLEDLEFMLQRQKDEFDEISHDSEEKMNF